MTTSPVQISFRNMSVSPVLEEEIRSRVAWLESFYAGIVGCRVLLEVPHRHRRRGRPLRVRIEAVVTGEDVIVNHEPSLDATVRSALRKSDELDGRHKDVHVAIRDAFDVARRRLGTWRGGNVSREVGMIAERLRHEVGLHGSFSVAQTHEWAWGLLACVHRGLCAIGGHDLFFTSSLVVCRCDASIAAGNHRDGRSKDRGSRSTWTINECEWALGRTVSRLDEAWSTTPLDVYAHYKQTLPTVPSASLISDDGHRVA